MPRATRFAAAVAIALISTPWCAAAQQTPRDTASHWTLGSPAALVAQIQGAPSVIERLASAGYATWYYGAAWIRFGFIDERVIGWSSTGELKVELRPGPDSTTSSMFTNGSTRDDVVRLQGTPGTLIERKDTGEQELRYGRATVRIGARDARVRSWDDPAHVLHARAPTAVPLRAYPRPIAPASLTATASFADEGGDGVFDAEERGTVTLVVRNNGRGTAYGATLTIAATPPTALTLASATTADSILSGQTVTLRAVVTASPRVADGELTLSAGVREYNGFDLDVPHVAHITTRAARAPHFALDGIAIADQSGNGRIEPREVVDVTARIVNRGPGDARGVHATIVTGPGVLLAPESPSDVAVGPMRAGESRDVHFTAYTNSRATGFPVSLALHDERARFDTSLVLPLALDRPIASEPALVVRGRNPSATAVPPPLVVDVDTGIPRGAPQRRTVAVVLGVERYQHAPAAPFARRDAAAFREYAARLFGTGDDPSTLFFRTDDEVTGGELRKVFGDGGWLARRADSATDVVVYFAGHGVADLKSHAPYILPNDADPNYPAQTGYALQELYERLAGLGAHSVTVFVDACFSGGTRDGASLFAGARDVVVSVEHPALRSETMAVFTASSGAQFANTAPDMRHGLFTYWVLKGLRGGAAGADPNADGRVSVGELEQFLRAHVASEAARQDREQMPETVARNKARTLVQRQ